MKQISSLALIVLALGACTNTQSRDDSGLSEAGIRMHAAMRECIKDGLTRNNAVEQADCIGDAKRQAAYQINNPYMGNVERDIAADRKSALQFAAGTISEEAYIRALDKHWAQALRADDKARTHSRQWEEYAALRAERDAQIVDANNLALAGARECVNQRHAGILKTFAESAECSNPQIIAAYERVRFPYMDLVKQYTDRKLDIMEQLDHHTIPAARADKELAECRAYLQAAAHVRDLEQE
jgi:hypothetical protein